MALPPKLDALCREMAHVRGETLRLLSLLSDEAFERREPGEWSAAEVLHHLIIAETGASKVIRKVLKDRAGTLSPYPADDSGFCVREPRAPVGGLRAPEAAVPRDTPPREALLRLAAETREQTEKSLGMLAPFDPTAAAFPHPVLGDMTLYEWLAVIVVGHERGHHAQIRAIAESAGVPKEVIGG